MKKRKFAEGGTPALDALASGEDAGGFDTETYKKAKAFLSKRQNSDMQEEKPARMAPRATAEKAKQRVAEKAKAEPAQEENSSKERAGPTVKRAEAQAKAKAESEAEYAEKTRPGRDAIENVYPEAVLLGGTGIRGMMGRKGAAEAAGSAERGLATSTTPISYLGRSGPKNITPMERLAGRQEPRLEFGAAKIGNEAEGIAQLASRAPKPTGPSQSAAARQIAMKPAAAKNKELTDEILDILRGSSADEAGIDFKKGGKIKRYAAGGSVSSASRRGDGIAQRGKTNCKMR